PRRRAAGGLLHAGRERAGRGIRLLPEGPAIPRAWLRRHQPGQGQGDEAADPHAQLLSSWPAASGRTPAGRVRTPVALEGRKDFGRSFLLGRGGPCSRFVAPGQETFRVAAVGADTAAGPCYGAGPAGRTRQEPREETYVADETVGHTRHHRAGPGGH